MWHGKQGVVQLCASIWFLLSVSASCIEHWQGDLVAAVESGGHAGPPLRRYWGLALRVCDEARAHTGRRRRIPCTLPWRVPALNGRSARSCSGAQDASGGARVCQGSRGGQVQSVCGGEGGVDAAAPAAEACDAAGRGGDGAGLASRRVAH
eukprot:2365350-Pleurochrysis_carterae.AAC.3